MNTYQLPFGQFRLLLIALCLSLLPTLPVWADSDGYRDSVDGYPCDYNCKTPRRGDEIYLLSTRCLPGGCGWELPVEKISVQKFVVGEGWQPVDWKTFTESSSPGGLTSIYVHGNWMSRYWAQRRGWEMYHELTRQLPMDQKVRYIMWSWPTQEEPHPLRTVREHAVRADDDAYYLASYLETLTPKEKVSISAFSLGARVVTGACHLMAGGQLRGRALPEHEKNEHGYRIAFFSAGVTYSALYPSGRNGEAMDVIDALYNEINSADKILRHYQMATQRKGDQAAGSVGFCLTPDQAEKVQQVNAANILGSEHSWDKVCCAYCVMQQARVYLQWKDLKQDTKKQGA
ncbi:hypothetical protein GC197_00750 [bacterium]|nr:hypothetical protein [bacterium]